MEKTPRRTLVEVERTKDITTPRGRRPVQRRSPDGNWKGHGSAHSTSLFWAFPTFPIVCAARGFRNTRGFESLWTSPLWDARASRYAAEFSILLRLPIVWVWLFLLGSWNSGVKVERSETRATSSDESSKFCATDDSISCRSSGSRPFVVCL